MFEIAKCFLDCRCSSHRMAEQYFRAWNETDELRRLVLLQKVFVSTARYEEPMDHACSLRELDRLICGVQTRFPGFHFTLNEVRAERDRSVRFEWSFGQEGSPALFTGSDVAVIEQGRLVEVSRVIDDLPATSE